MALGLMVSLDIPLPQELSVGSGSAVFVCGTCFHRDGRLSSLHFVLDGVEQPVAAHSMPRLDYFASLHPGLDPFGTAELATDPDSPDDPNLMGYRSGFWGIVVLEAGASGPLELRLRGRLEGGGEAEVPLHRFNPRSLPEPLPLRQGGRGPGEPLIAVCMATYNPPADLLQRQLDSIRAQTHPNWVCVISDDCSDPDRFAVLREMVEGDERFLLSRSEQRQGFYLNFERALALAPREAELLALADQDDRWYPHKLRGLADELGHAQLVYSDARIVDQSGRELAGSYWGTRENNHRDLLSLLVANSVTGAASLFRADLLNDLLPFPPAQFAHYHDHWLGLVALSLGEVGFVEEPLYDYVQHGGAALGHAAANRMLALRDRIAALRRDPHERVRMWRLHYFVDVARLRQFATVLRLRCGERMPAGKRRALDRFLSAEHSLPAVGRLAVRGARELLGRGKPQTLGAEWMLAYAFAWRRLLSLSARPRPQRTLRLDAVPPPDLVLHPGQRAAEPSPAREIAEKIAPLRWAVSDAAPERINILIPTIDLAHFFGGYIAKLNLARRLAEHGRRVRLVTVDPVAPLPRDWRDRLEAYSGLAGVFEQVEVTFGREATAIEVSRRDRFIASTWWTAHIAHDAVRELEPETFLYLIQEYEPFTFPMGTFAALAEESYRFPHRALFSTELLRDYFRRRELGVFSRGVAAGDESSLAFQNAITPIEPVSEAELAARRSRRLLFYARPEAHAARNMFELGVLALEEAAARGAFAGGWELHGIGTVQGERRLELGGGAVLRLLPRADQSSYAELLRGYDLGLALMYTPHPSLVPIEMASAGMLTVTNTFENKTPARLSEISSNLIAAEPTVAGVAGALVRAADAVDDAGRRAGGSAVAWSRSWATSLDERVLARVLALLDA